MRAVDTPPTPAAAAHEATLADVVHGWFNPATAHGMVLITVTAGIVLWLLTVYLPAHLKITVTWR